MFDQLMVPDSRMFSCAKHQIQMFLIILFLSGATPQPAITAKMPEQLIALSGSCLLIPCLFNPSAHITPPPQFTQNSNGVWMIKNTQFEKEPNNVIYNGSTLDNQYSMEIIGKLIERNCTSILNSITLLHVNTYFFRIEDPSFRASASRNPCKIEVLELPPSPNITIPGSLQEGVSVSVTCSAVAPCPTLPPQLKWTGPQLTAQEETLQQNSDQTKSAQLTGKFSPAAWHHGTNITCTASYPNEAQHIKIAAVTVTLNVSFSPQNTSASIRPADPVSVGSNVTLSCTSSANPPVSNIRWFRGSTTVGVGDTLTITVSEADRGRYICVAANLLGQTSAEVELNIREELPNTWLYVMIGSGTAILLLFVLLLAVIGWRRKSSGSANRGEMLAASTSQLTLPVRSEETSSPGRAPGHAPGHAPGAPGEADGLPSQCEEVQYGEIDFSKLQPRFNKTGEKHSETEYGEVRREGHAHTGPGHAHMTRPRP